MGKHNKETKSSKPLKIKEKLLSKYSSIAMENSGYEISFKQVDQFLKSPSKKRITKENTQYNGDWII